MEKSDKKTIEFKLNQIKQLISEKYYLTLLLHFEILESITTNSLLSQLNGKIIFQVLNGMEVIINIIYGCLEMEKTEKEL